MRTLRVFAVLAAVACLALSAATVAADGASSDGKPVKVGWEARRVARFFKDAGAEVTPEVVQSVGLTVNDIVNGMLDVEVLEELGVTSALQRKRVLAAAADIDPASVASGAEPGASAIPLPGSVDDADGGWDARALADFFLAEADVEVSVESIVATGLTVDRLFDQGLDDETLEALGVDTALERNRVFRAVSLLDARISAAPKTLLEWRAANLRLCDFWLVPLSNSPRAFSLYIRYFHWDEGSYVKAVDHYYMDTGFIQFWLQLILCPSLPAFRAAWDYHDDSAYFDNLLKAVMFVKILVELALLVKNPAAWRKQLFAELLGGFLGSAFMYYIFWWFWPRFLINFWFTMQLYLVLPLFVIGSIINVLSGKPAGDNHAHAD